MRKALAAVALSGALSAVPMVADAAQTGPPTTVETSLVERQVPVPTVSELVKKSDADSSNWGWIGIFGLLGLGGLAGLAGKRKRDDDRPRGYGSPIASDSTPRGSTPTKSD